MNAILTRLVETSLYASVLFGLILLLRFALKRRISPRVQYALWLLLVLRLLVPVTAESPVHLPALFPKAALTASAEQDAETGVARQPVFDTSALPYRAGVPTGGAHGGTAQNAWDGVSPQDRASPVDVTALVFAAYLLGATGLALWLFGSRRRFLRHVTLNAVAPSRALQRQFRACCAAVGARGRVRLAVTDMRISPLLLRSRGTALVVLPRSLAGDAEAARYAMLHELTHNRRGDDRMLLLLAALRCVYWFHPLVHIAFSEMQADMETACDAGVLRMLRPEEKRTYLVTLLTLFTYKRQPAPAMASAHTKRLAAKRMKGAFMKQKTNVPVLILTLILCLAMVAGCFTTACSPRSVAADSGAKAVEIQSFPPESGAGALLQSADANAIVVQSADGRQYTFRAVDRGVAEYSQRQPDGTEASAITAAANAARDAVSFFGDAVPEGEINVLYTSYALGAAFYSLDFGSADAAGGKPLFSARADAATGEVQSVSRRLEAVLDNQKQNDLINGFRWEDYKLEEDVVPAVYAKAKERIESLYPDSIVVDRNPDAFDMERSYVDGIQVYFVGEQTELYCDVYLRTTKGPCYYVQVCYPSLMIAAVERYGIGWEGCKRRIFDEATLEAESVERVETEATEEELALLVQAAKAYVGKEYPIQESEFGGGQLNYSLHFLFHCVFQTVFGDVGYGSVPVLGFSADKTPTDAVPGHELVFTGASGASDDLLSTLYVGDGKCVYADLSTKKIVEASVEDLMRLYPNGCRVNVPTIDRGTKDSQTAMPAPEPEPIPAG